MSRVADSPIAVPKGVEVVIKDGDINVKGSKGALHLKVYEGIEIAQEDDELRVSVASEERTKVAMAGTMRALVSNMVTGVSTGFQRELQLVGIGYRAQASGKKLTLTLGFSHPVEYQVPEGIEVECPAPTQIFVRGADKQQVGQVAAEIRAFRPPEPYKGKGVRYADEYVKRKEAKKK